jgi:hypothetical protein
MLTITRSCGTNVTRSCPGAPPRKICSTVSGEGVGAPRQQNALTDLGLPEPGEARQPEPDQTIRQPLERRAGELRQRQHVHRVRPCSFDGVEHTLDVVAHRNDHRLGPGLRHLLLDAAFQARHLGDRGCTHEHSEAL